MGAARAYGRGTQVLWSGTQQAMDLAILFRFLAWNVREVGVAHNG
ncbi:hypothetical protein A2U01_0066769, partial [Trifolium medium]|nr:hypothetical protein [Trifolium medium]